VDWKLLLPMNRGKRDVLEEVCKGNYKVERGISL